MFIFLILIIAINTIEPVMKKIKMHIHNIKCIHDVNIDLPLERGLYAITGQNGSGKSTIVACASSMFLRLPMKDYFGETDPDAFIEFSLDGNTRSWRKNANLKWEASSSGNMNIRGFYEGSLIFGYRFKDTTYEKLKRLSSVDKSKLHSSHEFIRKNLGLILQGDENYYDHLYEVSRDYEGFNGSVFFYEKNGRLISQFHMSTGENLLISILNSLYIKNKEKKKGSKASIIFLDEIELALHPSSLKRLVVFLENMAKEYEYAIYFSTHSIELISGIKPDNIFYVERFSDGKIYITNPCYPAYATKFLYDHSGYDKVILVEDDLAKSIISRILRDQRLLDSKLVHVLPCGGYSNVIRLADDVIKNNLLGKIASICIVLDLDVRDKAIEFKKKNNYANSANMNFLPIDSLEKYLRKNLFIDVNPKLFKLLSDYLFLQTSLQSLVEGYKVSEDSKEDGSGKVLYTILDEELRKHNKSREDLTEMIVQFIFENEKSKIEKLITFLKRELSV